MKDNIKPTIVLAAICIVSSVLLVFSHEVTKDRIAYQKELQFGTAVEALFGKTEFRLLDDTFSAEGIESIAVTSSGKTAVMVVADGYSKKGINALIGIDENGAVSGIEFVSLGETPGLGSKIRDDLSFRQQFFGKTESSDNLDAISGATYSSNGMKNAVNMALDVYNQNKEAILNGGK